MKKKTKKPVIEIKQDHIFVEFLIYSDTLTPDDISKEIGILYEKGSTKGELMFPKTSSKAIQKINLWQIGADKYYPYDKEYPNVEGLHAETNLEELTELVLAKLDDDVISKINFLVEKELITAKLLCAVYCHTQPPMIFTKASIAKIHKLGAEIDIDYYNIGCEK